MTRWAVQQTYSDSVNRRHLASGDHTHLVTHTHTHNFISHALTPVGSGTFSMPHHLWSTDVLASITDSAAFLVEAGCSCRVSHISTVRKASCCHSVCTCQSVYRSPLQECVWCWISSHTELHTEEWQCLVYDSGKHRGEDESKGTGRGTGDSSGKCRVKQKEGGFLRFFF